MVWWEHDAWWVRDLGSRNGTYVDGRKLNVGEVVQLDRNSEIGFAVPDDPWTLTDAAPPAGTDHPDLARTEDAAPDEDATQRVAVHFAVSPDEEYVEVTLNLGGETHRLEARTYHYMLLTLGRAVLNDIDAGVEGGARGWMYATDLARMLRIDERTLNVHVFRARRQVEQAGLPAEAPFLQRLGRLGQIRLAVDEVTVRTLETTA